MDYMPLRIAVMPSWANTVLTGVLLMNSVVVMFLAFAGVVTALYVANRRMQKAIVRLRCSCKTLWHKAAYHPLIDVELPPPSTSNHSPKPLVRQFLRPTMLVDGMGLIFLVQEPVTEPVDSTGAILTIFFVLLVLALVIRRLRTRRKHPLQRTFDDYLKELHRESNDYLDKVNRLYRNK